MHNILIILINKNIAWRKSNEEKNLNWIGNWGLLPETLPWTMAEEMIKVNGSAFIFEEELTGHAFPRLGSVEDPSITGTMALRMSGCAGLREASGEL